MSDDAAAAGGGYSCAALHPDGLILCTGTADAAVRIWETRTQKVGAAADGAAPTASAAVRAAACRGTRLGVLGTRSRWMPLCPFLDS